MKLSGKLSGRGLALAAACVLIALGFNGCKKKAQVLAANALTYSSEKSYSPDGKFRVVAVSPSEVLPSGVKYPSIQVQFSEPAIALQQLGEPSDRSDLVTIEPPLKGVFRWYGTSLLSFEAKEEVIPQKVYTIKVSKDAKSVTGKQVEGQLEYSFHPEELELRAIVPGWEDVRKGAWVDSESVPPEAARDIMLTFNFPVNKDVVSKYIKVTAGEEELKFSPSQEDKKNSLRLKLSALPPEDTDIYVTLDEGAMADADCYQTSERQDRHFHTLVPFALDDFDPEPYVSGKYVNPVAFRFTSLLKQDSEAELAKFITTSLGQPVTADNLKVSGKQLIVHSLPVTFGSQYTITIKPGFFDVYGRKTNDDGTFSVEVPDARSFAYFKDSGLKILEAEFDPKLAFEHQNVKAPSSYSVRAVADNQGRAQDSAAGTTVLDPDVIPQNVSVIEGVDLKPYLTKSGDQYHGTVRFDAEMTYEYKYTDWRTDVKVKKTDVTRNSQTVQVTDLGVTARYGYDSAAVMVTRLSTGEPVPGAEVKVYAAPSSWSDRDSALDTVSLTGFRQLGSAARTDKDGFATISYAFPDTSVYCFYIEAKTSDDRVVYRADSHDFWRSGISNYEPMRDAVTPRGVTFMFTDRGLYKPGEKLSFRGYDKNLVSGKYSAYKGNYTLTLTDGSWNGKSYWTSSGRTSENGTFYGSFTVPADLEPGDYRIKYERERPDGGTYTDYCYFQVQFFERLRFEVSSLAPSVTFYSGDSVSVDVKASYLGGGSMAGSSYDSSWSREKSFFRPKGSRFDGFRFGPEQGYDYYTSLDSDSGALDDDGRASVSQKSGGEKIIGSPYNYRVQTLVNDQGGQQIASTATVMVHPARYYLGVRRTDGNGFPKKGDKVSFSYVCITPDGEAPLAGDLPSQKKLKVELLREDWKQVQQISWSGAVNTRYEKEIVTESESETSLSGTDKETGITVTPEKGGEYYLRVSSTDSKGRDVVTEYSFYVISSDWYWGNRDDDEQIKMKTGKDSYEVGDTAQILVQSTIPAGRYLMTIEREGIISQEIRVIDSPTTVLEVPVKEDYVPVMYVTLSSYTKRSGKPVNDFDTPDVDKPKGLFGVAELVVNPTSKEFDVDIRTDKPNYEPGEKAKITVHASKGGKPLANAELTVMAVDRGVIDLINYHVPDPIQEFYRKWLFPDCVKGGDSRAYLIDPVTYEIKNLVGGDSDKGNERKNFDPTALFVPQIMTDANGDAVCEFTLPDSLTAYRITAVGIQGDNFALSESEMSVANPVSVRTALPRRLRVHDKGEAGCVISNIDGTDHKVTVMMTLHEGDTVTETAEGELGRKAGKAVLSGEPTKSITVPAGKTSPLMFSLDAVEEGWVTLEFTVRSDVLKEKVLLPLEIEKPYIYETVTTVGQVRGEGNKGKDSVEERLVLPADAEDGNMQFTVQLDPTRLGVLKEAVGYVFDYPYGCLEQRSSRILPLVAFGDYIKVFGLDSKVKKPASVAAKEIKSWAQYQKYDGGFPYWPSGTRSSPFVSARIAEILALADDGGIDISSFNIDALADYLVMQGNHCLKDKEPGSWACYEAAHYYYSASLLGATVSNANLSKIKEGCGSSSECLALCGLACLSMGNVNKAREFADALRGNISLTTRGASFSHGWDGSQWCFFSDQSEKFALALQLYTALDPAASLNQNLVYELLELQKAGRGYWTSTAATARVLIAIRQYIRGNKLEDLNFTAQALLDKKEIAKGSFKGVAAEAVDATLDKDALSKFKKGEELPLVFEKDGTGTLFYTASMRYALPAARQYARDEGICIFSEIYDVKTGELVSGDELEAGRTYREKVYISTTRNREFVAVRVPVPAGSEILNAAFVTTGSYHGEPEARDDEDYYDDYGYGYDDYGYYDDDYNWGLSYQGIYDSEVQYFWDYFPIGFQQVDFLFRAVRSGEYETPSATAECMYQDEIFGRSQGKVWKIK
ncbi:MAG: alpha-2-macroglobulin [Treponema sp.]|nr:alpha-2-macroglobulin [Treponema sp.]